MDHSHMDHGSGHTMPGAPAAMCSMSVSILTTTYRSTLLLNTNVLTVLPTDAFHMEHE